MTTQPFLTTTISLNDGLELVREAINDERRRPDALRALQEWLDAIIGLSTHLVRARLWLTRSGQRPGAPASSDWHIDF